MSQSARVDSIEALKDFRASLWKFAEHARNALGSADAEVRRTISWLQDDRLRHWSNQIQKRSEKVKEAKAALNYKKLYKSPMGGDQSWVEEEKALQAAQKRLTEAQEKRENVKKWLRRMEQEAFIYKGQTQGVWQAVDVGIPNSAAYLDRALTALESYVAFSPEPLEGAAGSAARTESMARGAVASLISDEDQAKAAETLAGIREHTPDQATRDAIKVDAYRPTWLGGQAFDWPSEGRISVSDLEAVADLEVSRIPCVAREKIVLAGEVRGENLIYLERVATTSGDDSGWFIGLPDRSSEDHMAVRQEQLFEARPDLQPLMELPEGYLVIVDTDSIIAVLNARNELVWPEKQQGKDEIGYEELP